MCLITDHFASLLHLLFNLDNVSTILGRGYVLVTIKLLYDHAVFKSDDTINQSQKDLQAYIEEPEIHIIALSSSSVDDQTTLIDRLKCMKN